MFLRLCRHGLYMKEKLSIKMFSPRTAEYLMDATRITHSQYVMIALFSRINKWCDGSFICLQHVFLKTWSRISQTLELLTSKYCCIGIVRYLLARILTAVNGPSILSLNNNIKQDFSTFLVTNASF